MQGNKKKVAGILHDRRYTENKMRTIDVIQPTRWLITSLGALMAKMSMYGNFEAKGQTVKKCDQQLWKWPHAFI